MCWLLPSCPVHVSWSWWYRINHSKVLGCLPNRQVWESSFSGKHKHYFLTLETRLSVLEYFSMPSSRIFKPLCFVSCWFPASGFVSGTEQWEQPEVTTHQCKLVWSVGVLCFNVSVGCSSKVMVSSRLQRIFSRHCRCRHLSTHRIQMVPQFLQLRVTFCALQPLSVWVSERKVSLLLS